MSAMSHLIFPQTCHYHLLSAKDAIQVRNSQFVKLSNVNKTARGPGSVSNGPPYIPANLSLSNVPAKDAIQVRNSRFAKTSEDCIKGLVSLRFSGLIIIYLHKTVNSKPSLH